MSTSEVQPARTAPTQYDLLTSFTQYGELEDFSYRGAKRVSARIFVPTGRTKDQLTATLDRAARAIAKEARANAVSILAYGPQDDPTGPYTAASADYAPNGKWDDAHIEAPMQLRVDFNEAYFSTRP